MAVRSLTGLAEQSDGARRTATVRLSSIISVEDGHAIVAQGDSTVPTRRLASITLDDLNHALRNSLNVMIAPGDETDPRPIIVGIIADDPMPQLPLAQTTGTTTEPANPGDLVAHLDGRRVVLSAKDEIVLECGEASITLRRNGRIVIRGAYVETRSRGTNRIRGGSVRIN